MEQITSSYNLFVDSSTGHNAQTKGDDYIVNLQDAGVHAGEGEFIRMTLNNFSMAKNFLDINDTNNKFKFTYTTTGVPPNYNTQLLGNTITHTIDLGLDNGNYPSVTEIAQNMGEKIREELSQQIPGCVNTNPITVSPSINYDRIIAFSINTGGNHGITDAIIQFNIDEGDSYMILGGDRVKTGDNVTSSVDILLSPAQPSQLLVSCRYPAQRASMPFVYIRAPGTLNTNIETQGLRNSADNHKSDVAHSDILGRAVVESNEWVQFTGQMERDFFIDIHQKQLNVLRLRLTDSKNRLIGRMGGGNTAAGPGREQSTLGNLSFSAVIRFDIIKRKSVHHLETEHYQPPIPARFSEGNVPIKIR